MLVFILGGGARGDIQSLIILRPAAVLISCLALFTLKREHIRRYRTLFIIALLTLALILLHLVPLPPALWRSLPGRDFVSNVDATAGLGEVWRPISLTPLATWNAFYSMFVPLGVLLLGAQLSAEDQRYLLRVIIGLGLLSGVLGLMQVLGDPEGSLYFYRVTNNGSAVGLFANRNHQAVLLACLIPMLALLASQETRNSEAARARVYIAVAISFVLVPLILVTGSRAGVALGLLGLLSVPLLYRKPKAGASERRIAAPRALTIALGILAVMAIAVVTIVLGRAEAFNRIMTPDAVDEIRFKVWGPIARLAWQYFPFGSGIGGFAEVYQVDEPDQMLGINYLNHAHNDWLEVYMTGGLPASLLLGVAVICWLRCTFLVWRPTTGTPTRDIQFGRLGSILLLMLALASVGDYPLRVPSLVCCAVIFALWLRAPKGERSEAQLGKPGGSLAPSHIGR